MKRSWKTTVVGFLVGLVPLGQGILGGLANGQHFDWGKIGLGIGVGALGYFSKDFDVTGTPKIPEETQKPQ
jgi:hypothetical protein